MEMSDTQKNSGITHEHGVVRGWVHSFQSLGAVDGPGVRFVVFLQGCPLRCAYCHNPDTWAFPEVMIAKGCSGVAGGITAAGSNGIAGCTAAVAYTPEEVVKKILRFKPYIKNGGVTVSGGEALMQPEFVAGLFRLLQREGLHTALDTSGIGDLKKAADVLKYTNLVLADLKFSEPEDYKKYCGADMLQVLAFLDLTETMGVPLWIRHVVVPGLNDMPENIREIGRISHSYTNLEKLELLPFKKICMSKYDEMGMEFGLKDYEACSAARIAELEGYLASLRSRK